MPPGTAADEAFLRLLEKPEGEDAWRSAEGMDYAMGQLLRPAIGLPRRTDEALAGEVSSVGLSFVRVAERRLVFQKPEARASGAPRTAANR